MQLTVARKMILLIATAIVGLFAVGGMGMVQLEKTYTATSYAAINSVPSYQGLTETLTYFGNVRAASWAHVASTDESMMRELEKKIDKASAGMEESLRKYDTNGCAGGSCVSDEHERTLFADVKARFSDYTAARLQVMSLSKQNKTKEALELATTTMNPTAAKLNDAINAELDYNAVLAKKGTDEGAAAKASAGTLSMVICLVTLLVVCAIGWFITRNLLKALGGEPDFAAQVASKIAAGDLSSKIEVKAGDTGSLFYSMKQMQDSLTGIVGEINGMVDAAIGLPDLDGWSVMSMLKQNPVTQSIPVCVISGLESEVHDAASNAAGYLKKPVDKQQLNEVFDRLGTTNGQIRRILVVDDDVASRKAIAGVVEEHGAKLFEARDGLAALEMLESGPFDCMILDLELPDLSGFELLDRARSQGIAMPAIVVHTNKDLSYEESLALREYTDSIVVKGERSPERLVEEVIQFLRHVQPLEAPVEPVEDATVETLEGRKVLVVDDDMRNAFALSKVLRSKGLSVLLAQDGYKALAQLNANMDIELVLMDVMMPGMDGYDTIRAIRKEARYAGLPIIALTAKAMPGDREKCIEVGANDYYSKPVDVDHLLVAMSALFRD